MINKQWRKLCNGDWKMSMAVKGFFCNTNASKFETHHHLLRQVLARQSFPISSFPSYPILNNDDDKNKTPILRARAAAAAEDSNSTVNVSSTSDVKGSGTTARGRRFLKIREEKRKREFDRLHNYPSWAKYSLLSSSFMYIYHALYLFGLLPLWISFVCFIFFGIKNRVLENACKDDEELRAVLGDSIGDPEQMRKRVR